MTEGSHNPAAVRYKEITATADSAARRLRQHEAAKAARLEEEVAAARQRAQEADEQRDEVVAEVDKLWSMAMSALWEERWMQVTTKPDADTSAAPAERAEVVRRVTAAYRRLHESLDKQRWSPTSLLSRRRTE